MNPWFKLWYLKFKMPPGWRIKSYWFWLYSSNWCPGRSTNLPGFFHYAHSLVLLHKPWVAKPSPNREGEYKWFNKLDKIRLSLCYRHYGSPFNIWLKSYSAINTVARNLQCSSNSIYLSCYSLNAFPLSADNTVCSSSHQDTNTSKPHL